MLTPKHDLLTIWHFLVKETEELLHRYILIPKHVISYIVEKKSNHIGGFSNKNTKLLRPTHKIYNFIADNLRFIRVTFARVERNSSPAEAIVVPLADSLVANAEANARLCAHESESNRLRAKSAAACSNEIQMSSIEADDVCVCSLKRAITIGSARKSLRYWLPRRYYAKKQ
jgi:hypothetical protein